MTRLLAHASDRMLSFFVAGTTAGACVPEHGGLCWRYGCGGCGCTSDGRWIRMDCQGRFSCTGVCSGTIATRCVTTQNLC